MSTTGLKNGTKAPCPPVDADAAAGVVYRCCQHKPPKAKEMRTNEESGRLPDADPCLRRALSVFRERRDAEHQIQLFPRWKRKFVLHVELAPAHGVTKPTKGQQPTHTSWWPAAQLTPELRADLFTEGYEVGG